MSSQQILLGSGGAGADPVYIDNVFSTHLYTGTGSSRSVTNAIDLSGEGGMVWIKNRTTASSQHTIMDTERGAGKQIHTDDTMAQGSGRTDLLSSFNSNGFSIGGGDRYTNQTNDKYVSYSFRKTEKFFDVVTYTGTGSARTIAHSLGSVPGCIMVKCTSDAEPWEVYHRGTDSSSPEDYALILNNTDQREDYNEYWNDTAPTSTVFSLGTDDHVNGTSRTYVAYLFAHHDGDGMFGEDGDKDGIVCGKYTGNNNVNGTIVNLGWEPQYVLIKRTVTDGGQWVMLDSMRGTPTGNDVTNSPNDQYIYSQSTGIENDYEYLSFTSTGFQIKSTSGDVNSASTDYIFIAIRRSDGTVGKPAEAGTDVFHTVVGNSSATVPTFVTGFPVDFGMWREPGANSSWTAQSRHMGTTAFMLEASDAAYAQMNTAWDSNTGFHYSWNNSNQAWAWKRHKGFDCLIYKGTGANQTVSHSLGQTPEFITIKNLDSNVESGAYAESIAWHKDLVSGGYSNIPSTNVFMELSTSEGVGTGAWFNSTAPTSSVVTLGVNGNKYDVRHNKSGEHYQMLLFSSVEGICKVGSYTGNATADTAISCGFQPRFVIIKTMAGDGSSWLTFDSLRSGYALYLDTNQGQDTNTTWIELTSTGFEIKLTWGAINASGTKYIYYAHA